MKKKIVKCIISDEQFFGSNDIAHLNQRLFLPGQGLRFHLSHQNHLHDCRLTENVCRTSGLARLVHRKCN